MKKMIICLIAIAGIGVCLLLFWKKPVRKHLKVMTYPSFLSPYGPARALQEHFESFCECSIRWVKVEDSTLIPQRLLLRKDGMGVDVVIGLDQITFRASLKDIQWRDIDVSDIKLIPTASKWIYKGAVPISWSPLTFIGRENPLPAQLRGFLKNQFERKISMPQPQTSSLGLQFYFWIFSLFPKENAALFLNQWKKQLYTLSHSWSASYGLFQRGLADISFSFQTSLMYHEIEEKKKYSSFYSQQGHPYQVEIAAIPTSCREPALANLFVRFLLTKKAQSILMKKNYMLPVIENVVRNTPFETLSQLPLISYQKLDLFLSQKEKKMQEWEKIFNSP